VARACLHPDRQQLQEGGRVAAFNKRFGGLSLKK
jgi:large subunit ribosomal protein L31